MTMNAPTRVIERISTKKAKVGVFGIGHQPYWAQFAGLKEELEATTAEFERQLANYNVEVVSGGLIDTPQKAQQLGDYFRGQSIDLLICYAATYATSSIVLPVVQRAGVGVILVGLQPAAAMDCKTATTRDQLAHDNVTSLPEIAGVLIRAGQPPLDVIAGVLHDDARAWGKIEEWCRVAGVLRAVRNARVGYMGHTYEGMLDMHSDPTMFHAFFGLHIQMLEMCDLDEHVRQVSQADVKAMEDRIKDVFHFAEPGVDPIAGPVDEKDLEWSARVAVGLDNMLQYYQLDALAYYYRGLDNNRYEQLAAGMIVGSSLLTGSGVPIAGEADLKTCLAMLVMDRLGAGGSYAEFHPVDFVDDIVLVGHDGPAHIEISDDRPILRDLSVFHGKRGRGLSVEFKIKRGPVTLLGVTQTYDGRFKFVAGKGESVPGEIPATGNTNTRVRFASGAAGFVEAWSMEGPTHHFALGTGDQISVLQKLSKALDIELCVVE